MDFLCHHTRRYFSGAPILLDKDRHIGIQCIGSGRRPKQSQDRIGGFDIGLVAPAQNASGIAQCFLGHGVRSAGLRHNTLFRFTGGYSQPSFDPRHGGVHIAFFS